MPSVLPYRAEYSYGRTFCGICRLGITKDTLQIGVMLQDMTKDCLQPKWYDKSCFFTIRRPISVGAIDGFANLRYADQKEILNCLGVCNGNGTEAMSIDPDALDSADEIQIKQQNADFFAVYDKVKTLKNDECVAILSVKSQFVPDNKAEILTHLTDVICFGAFAPCPVCKNGQFVFRNNNYSCTGYDTPWSKCLFKVKEPKRIPIKLTEQYHELLGSHIEPRTRIIQNIAEIDDDDFELFAKQPLFGMEFMFIGETKRPKTELEEKIRKMGGKIATKIHKGLAAVISNEKEVNQSSNSTRDASNHRIQVVPEEFIDEVMDNDPIEVIVKKDLTKWGEDPYKRMPERKKAKAMEYTPKSNAPNVNTWKWKSGDVDNHPDDLKNKLGRNVKGNIYENGTLRYSVMLNFVDVSSNKNSYHKLQLVTYTGTEQWIIQCEGRIGTSVGSTCSNKFTNLDAARNEFNRIFLEKTGNDFSAAEFVKKPGKYYKVNIDNETLCRKLPKNSVTSKLSEPLFQLMKLLFVEKVMKSTLLEYCVDLDSLPLGLIHKQTILDAIDILGRISSMLSSNTQDPREIVMASNQFYSYFPQDFGLQRVPLINTHEMVNQKSGMLRYMLEKLDKYDVLTSELNQEKNLLDVCYEQLEDSAEIKMLNKSSGMYAQIYKYVHNTQLYKTECPELEYDPGKFEVDEIFEVTRHEELLRYAPYENHFNRQLLFHGSAIGNFVSILTNGLLITPLDARFHGSAFGKGIYFTDSSSKSVRYCYADGGVGLMLVCEVAAGYSDIRYNFDQSKLTSYCESVQAIGQYYPHPLHVCPDGLKIPNGKLIKRTEKAGIIFNEFIVFDETRVKIRYLVKIKK